jgi:ubiquinol-cytochrome c reductase iron-sulfur subunit
MIARQCDSAISARSVSRKMALAIEITKKPTSGTRRDFLYIATGAATAVGTLAVLFPMIDQMEPDASTLAAGGPVDFDLSRLQPGQQAVVRWRSRPVFIVNRTPAAVKTLQDPKLLAQLSDPGSSALQQPPYADNWHRSVKPEYSVLVGICTHLGCIPMFYPDPSDNLPSANWLGGYFCPCHGSKYDLAGPSSTACLLRTICPCRPIALSATRQFGSERTRLTSPGILLRSHKFDSVNLAF